MVALDLVGVVGVVRGRLDDVGVERALGEEVGGVILRSPSPRPGLPLFCLKAQPARLVGEDLDELAADDLAFLLRVDDTGEGVEEAVGGVDVAEVDVEPSGHHVDDTLALLEAEQPVVDEDAGQLAADGAVHKRRRHRRVDSAGEGADDAAVADLAADVRHRRVDEAGCFPVAAAPADVVEKVVDYLFAQRRVDDLGVELDADTAPLVAHRGHWRVARVGHHPEARRRAGDAIAMAHPNRHLVGHAAKDRLLVIHDHGGRPVFALAGGLHHAAERLSHQLHAVADR